MHTDQTARSMLALRRLRYLLPVAVLVLVGGSTFAACGGHEPSGAGHEPSAPAAAKPSHTEPPSAAAPSTEMDAAVAGAADAWAHRPAFTNAAAATEEAYAYALYHPRILEWMPCYCGCGAMGHGSNLDCYIKPAADGQVTFEEHASYCDLCVQITLKTKELMAQGASVHGARQAIDALFAGTVPGTPTEVPPG